MERLDKLKSVTVGFKNTEKNLPTLKSSTLISKGIISLSKVEIDCRPPAKTRAIRSSKVIEVEMPRSMSGFAIRKVRESPSDNRLLTKNNLETQSPLKQSLRDIKQQEGPPTVPLSIQKSKISSKSYGLIKGYSANSHPGPILSYNQDRICIITNLTKTNVKQKQISFFGVYDGKDGVTKADYLRDNFHVCLLEDDAFPRDMEYAMKRTVRRLSAAYQEDSKSMGDDSSVGFVVLVCFIKMDLSVDEQMHYLQSGTCKAVFSANLGQNIFCPSNSQTAVLTKQTAKKAKSVGQLIMKRTAGKGYKQSIQLQYRKFSQVDNLDFIILGSEGLFQNFKIKDVGKKLWLSLLKNKEQSLHFALGEASNNLMADVFAGLGTKNTSIIIVAMDPVLSCLENQQNKEQLSLPYVCSSMNL